MILLWGLPSDKPISAVYSILCGLGHSEKLFFFDQERDLLKTNIELFVDSDLEGNIRVDNGETHKEVDLRDITSSYLRPHDWRYLPGIEGTDKGSDQWHHASEVEDTMMSWSDLTTTSLVINRPSAMASNSSKPYQAMQIQSIGFNTPDTLITTDPKAALEFWRYHGTVIYKSISGVRSIVSRLDSSHIERMEYVSWCPTQFQEYVHGIDYRVHVVGDEVFACKITSKADDYRYAARQGLSVKILSCPIPEDIKDRCMCLAKSLRLTVSGIDLRHNPDSGKWYCFEVNPSPAYTYYQERTGLRIDKAIAELLINEDKK